MSLHELAEAEMVSEVAGRTRPAVSDQAIVEGRIEAVEAGR